MSVAKPIALKPAALRALASIRAHELKGVHVPLSESPWERSNLTALALAGLISAETGRIRTTDSGVAHIAANIDALCAEPARLDAIEGTNEVAAIKASLALTGGAS